MGRGQRYCLDSERRSECNKRRISPLVLGRGTTRQPPEDGVPLRKLSLLGRSKQHVKLSLNDEVIAFAKPELLHFSPQDELRLLQVN